MRALWDRPTHPSCTGVLLMFLDPSHTHIVTEHCCCSCACSVLLLLLLLLLPYQLCLPCRACLHT
jgi:hypothetical protein